MMQGSPKQVAWAEKIIADHDKWLTQDGLKYLTPKELGGWDLAELRTAWEAAKQIITTSLGARGWIDLRGLSVKTLAHAAKLGILPELTGTPKQIAYAGSLRLGKALEILGDVNPALINETVDAILRQTESKFWIEANPGIVAQRINIKYQTKLRQAAATPAVAKPMSAPAVSAADVGGAAATTAKRAAASVLGEAERARVHKILEAYDDLKFIREHRPDLAANIDALLDQEMLGLERAIRSARTNTRQAQSLTDYYGQQAMVDIETAEGHITAARDLLRAEPEPIPIPEVTADMVDQMRAVIRVGQESMMGMVQAQTYDIAARYLGPKTAAEFLARAELPDIPAVTAETILGVLQKSIADRDTNTTLIDKIMEAADVADWQAERIARTETAHAENAARIERYRQDGTQYVEFVADETERTCEECAQYHGKIFALGTEPELPIHPNCRCTYVAAYPNGLPAIGEE